MSGLVVENVPAASALPVFALLSINLAAEIRACSRRTLEIEARKGWIHIQTVVLLWKTSVSQIQIQLSLNPGFWAEDEAR